MSSFILHLSRAGQRFPGVLESAVAGWISSIWNCSWRQPRF